MNILENVLKSIRVKQLKFKITKLEANLQYVKSQLEQIEEKCSHDLIIHLGSENIYSSENDYAICLTCGKKIHLNDRNNPINETINSSNIISVVEFIPIKYRCKVVGNERYNFLVLRAQKKLEELSTSQQNLSKETIKTIIASDLHGYVQEEIKREEKQLELIRNMRNK